MRVGLVILALLLSLNGVIGCKSEPIPVVMGNKVGESYIQFAAISQPDTYVSSATTYTGEAHCFEDRNLGDKCKEQTSHNGAIDGDPMPFIDNTHYTFVAGKLLKIESVGLGGLVGTPSENINWNNYLRVLNDCFGKPERQSVKEALWLRHGYVVHAYLTFGNLPYSGDPAHDEHIVIEDRKYYEQEDAKSLD